MITAEELKETIKEIDLPIGQYVLGGTSVMLLRGINPRPIGDIDLFCTTEAWLDKLRSGWMSYSPDPLDKLRRCDPPYLYRKFDAIQAHIFFAWRIRTQGNFLVTELIETCEYVDGIPCMSLNFLLEWKREVMRDKDIVDVKAIEQYLGVTT